MIDFPEKYSAILTGPPGVGKHIYFLDLMKKYLENGESVTYITTERSPKEIKEIAKKAGLDLDQYEGSKFIFIDLYSHSTGERYDNGFTIDNPANLNLITVNLTKAADIVGKPMRLFFDSLSTLFLHAPEPEIKKFFGVLSSRVKTDYGSITYTLQDEMHDDQTVVGLKAMVDGVLEMRFEEGPPMKNLFRIHHAKGLKTAPTWHEFEVEEGVFKIIGEFVQEKAGAEAAPAAPTTVVVEQKGVPTSVLLLGVIGFLALAGGGGYYFMFMGGGGGEVVEEGPLEISDFYVESFETLPTVNVNGEEVTPYIDIKSRKDSKAPEKGWLVMQNPFYKIELNLDHPYYRLYDKVVDTEVTFYDDKVENPIEELTGSDIGYRGGKGENSLADETSTARHDKDGIPKYSIVYEDSGNGFILLNTEGWDAQCCESGGGYDAEAEVMLGLFADKPYFIDAMEFNNLQRVRVPPVLPKTPRMTRDPVEIVRSWVLQASYSAGVIRGGDSDHLNEVQYEGLRKVNSLEGTRKPFHFGSAAHAKMFPDDMLFGDKTGGAIIFSTPQGRPRWDDSLGVYGEQIAGQFVINIDRPTQKAMAWVIEPVNELEFLYDYIEFSTVPGYPEELQRLLEKYGMEYPGGVIPYNEWTTKRPVQVITLAPKGWYSAATNKPSDATWALADEAMDDYKKYEDILYTQLESTYPVAKTLLK